MSLKEKQAALDAKIDAYCDWLKANKEKKLSRKKQDICGNAFIKVRLQKLRAASVRACGFG